MLPAILFELFCTVTDCARRKIDGRVLLAGAAGGLLHTARQLGTGARDWYDILPALLPGLLLLGLSFLTEEKIGRGDGDMVLILGLLTDRRICAAVLLTACLLAAAFAGAGLLFRRLRRDSRIPFAPFLLAANLFLWIMERTI